jgi:hypothetical protein
MYRWESVRETVKSKNIKRMREDAAASLRPSAERICILAGMRYYSSSWSQKRKEPADAFSMHGSSSGLVEMRTYIFVDCTEGGWSWAPRAPEWSVGRVSNAAVRGTLFLAVQECVDGRIKLVTALEEVELEDEDVAHERAAKLLDERACCCCGATCVVSLAMSSVTGGRCSAAHTSRDDVVDHEHLLARLHGVGLHLEEVAAVLLLVGSRLGGARQLALLADGRKAGAQSQRQAGAEQEAAGVQADHDVGLFVLLRDVEHQGADEVFVQRRVGEEGHDVLEQDARAGEVGELAQRALEP